MGVESVIPICEIIVKIYKIKKNVLDEVKKEENKFLITLEKGLREFEKLAKDKLISGKDAFILFSSYGFPLEMTKELAKEKRIKVDEEGYEKAFMEHQELSRKSTVGRFKSGLGDKSIETTRLHTATHLLHGALRKVLGKDVYQRGSNITAERLRFDFSFDRKLTDKEIEKVEDLVNSQINKKIEVKREEMETDKALKSGAVGVFGGRYGEKVSVYSVGEFDREICAGPHVKNTKELGKFKIVKEESVAAGVRRIKAVLE